MNFLKSLLAVITNVDTYLFRVTDESLEEVQRLNSSGWAVELSADIRDLAISDESQVTLYRN